MTAPKPNDLRPMSITFAGEKIFANGFVTYIFMGSELAASIVPDTQATYMMSPRTY
jgi:hypothetical protein